MISASKNFHTTRWTIVRKAQGETPEAKSALSELCQTYYTPIFRFLLLQGKSHDEAEELSHSFFARLLGKNSIHHADQKKGRFRSYLLGALKHYLAEDHRNKGRLKRGGNIKHQSLDEPATEATSSPQLTDPTSSIPDSYFDREWALTLMDRGLRTVEATFTKSGKPLHFKTLKPWLMGDSTTLCQASAAVALNLSPGAIKVSIHRLRKAFADAIRAEIAQTVDTPEEISQELNYLIEVISKVA
ncbi:ECF-type sigma factor [Akkermansiaceae bacterium]|jgi:DNA-directed RNA polymerase specialized sigma24 family protein|nr:hypothetical protein [Verrucomicrobiota bacterium]MDA7530260.1 ECF-type sigma factor [bacterium]MDA7655143.1 ECF-type sigma factor [Akkermansiaceae bacterium]MDA7671450.1 ECF-type sigma factor [Akkermansiaceae bacterium]MDB4622394.1 ECF-type sigma factor [Akkermansiaceae bacterium]